MEEDQELQNPFPSPPSHYVNYTAHNLHLLSLLKSRLDTSIDTNALSDTDVVKKQHELLEEEKDVPDWPLTQLEKPRLDWILEDGEYSAFGDTWFTKERIPSLAEMGGTQLYPDDPTVDRRPALQSVLRTLLKTYSSFLSSILAPPPPQTSELPPDWHRLVEWMRVMGQNIMGAANDLRPVQARANLEAMMTRQLELRREETKAIHEKCDTLDMKLAELRQLATAAAGVPVEEEPIPSPKKPTEETMDVDALFEDESIRSTPPPPPEDHSSPAKSEAIQPPAPQKITEDDLLRWAEGVESEGG